MNIDQRIMESRHKIGDEVIIRAKVAGVQFTNSKVRYAFDIGPNLSIVDSEHVQAIGKQFHATGVWQVPKEEIVDHAVIVPTKDYK